MYLEVSAGITREPTDIDLDPILFGVQPLRRVDEFHYLGIRVDCHWLWVVQINNTTKSLIRLKWIFRKIRFFVNKVLKSMYNALVVSLVSYGVACCVGK